MFTFLHAADIHLDSPLRGLNRYEGAPAEEIRGATRRALEKLVDCAIRERVAFVILAGDLYDGDWPDFNTGLFFVGQMSRLREAGIPVFGVQGNHDAASKITRSLPLPKNVHIFPATAAGTELLEEFNVAIHGQSFASQCTSVDLAKNYPRAVPGYFNLGVLHTSLDGREGHASYAPCSVVTLNASGYDYWALGHIHQRDVLAGPPTIAFPGNIQGRHIRETGPKGCLLVHVDDRKAVKTLFEPLDILRWAVSTVSLTGVREKFEALDKVDDELRSLVEEAEDRLMAVRVMLTGTTPLAADISANAKQWNADIQSRAVDLGSDRIWVEKIKNQTTLPVVADVGSGDDTPIAEIAALVAQFSRTETAASDLGVDFSEFERKLAAIDLKVIDSSNAQWWQDILREAEAKLLSEMKG